LRTAFGERHPNHAVPDPPPPPKPQGVISEFRPPRGAPQPDPPPALALTANGLWALLTAAGLLLTASAARGARRWRFLRGWARAGVADYACPLAFAAWTALSFALRGVPGAPRRVATPNTWELTGAWAVAARMRDVPAAYVAAALVPAAVIAVLFFFDHSVSSQMAQQPEFNLKWAPAVCLFWLAGRPQGAPPRAARTPPVAGPDWRGADREWEGPRPTHCA
jgi:hypothetical protein